MLTTLTSNNNGIHYSSSIYEQSMINLYSFSIYGTHMAQAEKEEPCLDFLSPQFDPMRALHADPADVHLPYPDIQPYDNLEAYDSVMRGVRRQAPSGAAHEPAVQELEEEKVGGVAAVTKHHLKSVIHFMECKLVKQHSTTLLQTSTIILQLPLTALSHCCSSVIAEG